METYEHIRKQAQAAANADGFDRGVEKLGDRWRFFMLPQVRNRYGYELRCEVVSSMDLAKCQPGHGPVPVQRWVEQALARGVERIMRRRPRPMP